MMSTRFAFVLVAILLFIASAAAQIRPPTPFVDKGACPFECCTYRQWTVDKATIVHSTMSDSAPVAFRLRRGERVRGLTGTVITTQPGIAEALKDTVQDPVKLVAGDRIYLLTHLGEGFVKAWFKGRIFQAEALYPELFRIVRDPKAVWWVKVRNSKGKTGWSREPDSFGNKDQCG
jgi:hypothetical protein